MAYSDVGIANLALYELGVNRISAFDENSKAAIFVNAVWEYIRDEVLSAKDWYFAKERVALSQLEDTPVSYWDYAYALPDDFLKIARTKEDDRSVYPEGSYAYVLEDGTIKIQGLAYGYTIETLSNGSICLFTNYDNSDYNLFLTYIKKVVDPAKYSPSFIKALSYRLAEKGAIHLTEDKNKEKEMSVKYENALEDAEAHNMSMGFVVDETGSDDWDMTGR